MMKIYAFFSALLLWSNGLISAADVTNPETGTPSPAFSALIAGQALPKQFRVVTLPKIAVNRFSLVSDDGQTVLQVASDNSAGSVALPLTSAAGNSQVLLKWRWKVSRVLDQADMTAKPADDFAARVYVFFDVPLASLSLIDRSKIRLARLLAGADVPTAALCYVWDNTQRVGHTQWSPYTNRVRMIVLQTGNANVNKWLSESRHVAADFRDAFGIDAPAITGVAIGNDTDNTHERVSTWYGDVALKSPATQQSTDAK